MPPELPLGSLDQPKDLRAVLLAGLSNSQGRNRQAPRAAPPRSTGSPSRCRLQYASSPEGVSRRVALRLLLSCGGNLEGCPRGSIIARTSLTCSPCQSSSSEPNASLSARTQYQTLERGDVGLNQYASGDRLSRCGCLTLGGRDHQTAKLGDLGDLLANT